MTEAMTDTMTETRTTDTKSVAIILECDLAAPPAKVWRALTDPTLVASWLMPNDMALERRPDFTLAGTPEDGGTIECELLASEEPRRLSYRWRAARPDSEAAPLDTVVTFELAPTPDGGTRLRIEHGGFIVPKDFPVDGVVDVEEILVLLPADAVSRRRLRRPRPAALIRRAMPATMRLAA